MNRVCGHTHCHKDFMNRSIAGYKPLNLFSLTIDYSKNFTTNKVLTIGHMPMFVVKSIAIKFIVCLMDLSINRQVWDNL